MSIINSLLNSFFFFFHWEPIEPQTNFHYCIQKSLCKHSHTLCCIFIYIFHNQQTYTEMLIPTWINKQTKIQWNIKSISELETFAEFLIYFINKHDLCVWNVSFGIISIKSYDFHDDLHVYNDYIEKIMYMKKALYTLIWIWLITLTLILINMWSKLMHVK